MELIWVPKIDALDGGKSNLTRTINPIERSKFLIFFWKCDMFSPERCQLFIIYNLWHLWYTRIRKALWRYISLYNEMNKTFPQECGANLSFEWHLSVYNWMNWTYWEGTRQDWRYVTQLDRMLGLSLQNPLWVHARAWWMPNNNKSLQSEKVRQLSISTGLRSQRPTRWRRTILSWRASIRLNFRAASIGPLKRSSNDSAVKCLPSDSDIKSAASWTSRITGSHHLFNLRHPLINCPLITTINSNSRAFIWISFDSSHVTVKWFEAQSM